MRLTRKQAEQLDSTINEKINNQYSGNKLVIPGELPTMNEIINKSKTHWAKYKKMKDSWEEIIAYYCDVQGIKYFSCVELEIVYYRKNKRYDPDNITAGKKVLIDGLVKAGVLDNDGWKNIKGFTETWKVDKDNPRTEVEIKGC